MKSRTRGGILRAVAITLAGALVAAGGAGAAQAAAGKPVIDPTIPGSITIHKFEYPDNLAPLANTGMPLPQGSIPSGYEPLAGVTFKVDQVLGYDLTKNNDWLRLEGLTPAAAAADTDNLLLVGEKTTGEDGEVTFAGLPVGVYLVTETAWPAGVTPVKPFLITVPLTNPANHAEWVYDVHVYPKNPVSTGIKTVDDDKAIKLGDTVTFTIKGDIPEVEVLDGYKIVDTLDSKLTYVNAVVTLTNNAPLTVDDDYTIAHNATTNTVTVQFTEAGRAKLVENSTAQVQVVITTTVREIGEIANTALVYPNAPSFGIEPGEPGGPTVTPEVVTKWGAIDLRKVNGNNEPLGGAKFSVYLSEDDAKNGVNPVEIDGATVFTTENDGTLRISGLRYSDFADGKDLVPTDPEYRTYWLAEVQAPTGYELLAHPISFVVTAETTKPLEVDKTIENVPSNAGFDLPLTGGMGTVALTAAGVLLIACALLLAARNRRREAAADD